VLISVQVVDLKASKKSAALEKHDTNALTINASERISDGIVMYFCRGRSVGQAEVNRRAATRASSGDACKSELR